ncbi:MAG: class I SAM-dependent methyltransferase [Alphaproteobacteria bacterium]|nr:class I SAM-dependent methyltransferase [Alphaproteobacteria bacterium]
MADGDWISFWDSKHTIFVGPRHIAAHFRRIAADLKPYAPAGGTMLDYGCGEALSAAELSEGVSRLILCEAAPNVRTVLAGRYASNPKIVVRKPEDVATMPGHSVDTVVMHSVSQYLSESDFDALLKSFHRLLKPGGSLVLGDVIPKRVSALGDGFALLRFAAQEGFYWAAVRGLLRTYFSSYWKLRKSIGIRRYSEAEIVAKLEAAGFKAQRARTNIGHNRARMTFIAHTA